MPVHVLQRPAGPAHAAAQTELCTVCSVTWRALGLNCECLGGLLSLLGVLLGIWWGEDSSHLHPASCTGTIPLACKSVAEASLTAALLEASTDCCSLKGFRPMVPLTKSSGIISDMEKGKRNPLMNACVPPISAGASAAYTRLWAVVKTLSGMPAFHSRGPGFQFCFCSPKAEVMAQVLGPSLPTRKVWVEFQAPGFGPALPGASGEYTSIGEPSVSPPFK